MAASLQAQQQPSSCLRGSGRNDDNNDDDRTTVYNTPYAEKQKHMTPPPPPPPPPKKKHLSRSYRTPFPLPGLVDLDVEAVLRGDGLHARLGTSSLSLREQPGGHGREHPRGAVEVHHLCMGATCVRLQCV